MTKHANYTFQSSRINSAQRQALNTVGHALKHRAIDFHTAAELSDMVKAGQIDDVMKRLEFDPSDEAN